MHTPFDAELPNLTWQHKWGVGFFLGVSYASTPQFWGFTSIYAYNHYCITTKSDVVTRGEGLCILGSATPPIPRQRSSRAPHLGVLLYLYLHPLTQNDQIRHGDTCGERRVFKSARPLHLHTCVARFVRDSWVSCPIRCTTLWGTDEGRLQSIFTTTVKLLQCNIDYKTRYVHPLLKFELNIATEQECFGFWYHFELWNFDAFYSQHRPK